MLGSLTDRSALFGNAGDDTGDITMRPEVVIANRVGDVLIKHTVLKADHFPVLFCALGLMLPFCWSVHVFEFLCVSVEIWRYRTSRDFVLSINMLQSRFPSELASAVLLQSASGAIKCSLSHALLPRSYPLPSCIALMRAPDLKSAAVTHTFNIASLVLCVATIWSAAHGSSRPAASHLLAGIFLQDASSV
eukprot:gene5786-5993_t